MDLSQRCAYRLVASCTCVCRLKDIYRADDGSTGYLMQHQIDKLEIVCEGAIHDMAYSPSRCVYCFCVFNCNNPMRKN